MDLKQILKKGFKVNLIKIPTRRTPQQIEHKIHEELDRARILNILKLVEVFLTDPNKTEEKTSSLVTLVGFLRQDLEAYKE